MVTVVCCRTRHRDTHDVWRQATLALTTPVLLPAISRRSINIRSDTLIWANFADAKEHFEDIISLKNA
ncbi:unnamed protein product [Arctia plantaginis]|uniref:Uncharacterized protein n=1 Tax=Arctia plantaginis TaxID=874455 RepID=A0A8S0ZDT7_ARCPL|nr:unnamed protein product [Arctia plantaginis]